MRHPGEQMQQRVGGSGLLAIRVEAGRHAAIMSDALVLRSEGY